MYLFKSLFIVSAFLFTSSLQAGYRSTYRGTADCGIAQDWPRENSLSVFNETCTVSLAISPDGLDRYGRTVGDVEWIVSDMVFTGTFIQVGNKYYFDFYNKKYSGYRTGTQGSDRRNNWFVDVGLSARTKVRLYHVNQ